MVVRAPELPADPLPPFTRRDLRSLALSRHDLDALLRDGRVVQPIRGAYLDARVADDPIARARALALVLPADAAAAHRTAAWCHGIDARGPGELDQPLPLECLVPAGHVVPHRAGLDAREAWLPDHDVVEVGGVPVTTAVRTACDLARYLKPFMALGVVDAFAHGGVDPAALAARIEDWRGERNVARARRLVRLCEPLTESFGESWTRLRIADAGFPLPRPQIWIRDGAGVGVYRLDMGWDEEHVAVEYDGVEFHSRPAHVARDIARRKRLAREFAWHAVGVGKGEVLGRSLELELGVGELLGLEPQIRRRLW
jgi:hypothetical protein